MIKQDKILVFCSIFMLISSIVALNTMITLKLDFRENFQENVIEDLNEHPYLSTTQSNYEIIEEIFTKKLADYETFGYFPQIYESSLQAIYYTLYILDALDQLDKVNQTALTGYIMTQYNDTSKLFMDQYAYRYLDTDFEQAYYPFTSVLEINCYAILSLSILGRLDLINTQDSMNFIWSCYNPEGSENGFIGQPYDSFLPINFKIATMDNTYYAIRTLDLVIIDWSMYNDEKSRLIQYISGLQSANGGFNNDNEIFFDSLAFAMFEPNLLSSYYCIKSLEILSSVNSIDITKFHQYLGDLYDNSIYSFQMCNFGMQDFANIIATSLGLELSDITGYTGINRNEVINFILTNRNDLGNWDSSTYYRNHELIDTFQIVHCLKESNEINQLTLQQKNQISNAICRLYQQYNGFSLVSKDYMSINLINSVVTSLDLFNRISDLDIQWLYNLVEECYQDLFYCYGFSGCSNFENFIGFRSYPIEYYNLGFRNYLDRPGFLYNHRSNYEALNSLLKIDKLDEFGSTRNLMDLINNIIDSQFLEAEYENFGAFLPFFTYTFKSVECQNQNIFFEYSYYAIKALELLLDYLNLGNLVDLSFNKAALYGYIRRNINETDSLLYFDANLNSDLETALQNTYYMIYILKALNLFDLNTQKIKQFVLQNLDYGNIKNIYYSYKISEILGLNIGFDVDSTIRLVKKVYSNMEYEFYESANCQVINQEIFLWICEMARNCEVNVECAYEESINLGMVNTITASFNNLIYEEYGQFTSVRFESEQFGILDLEKQFNDTFQVNFMVPEDPQYYPYVEGMLRIYDHSKIIKEIPIFFQTCLEQVIEYEIREGNNNIIFDVNISRKLANEFQAVYNATVRVQIFRNDVYINNYTFSKKDFSDYSKFTYSYELNDDSNYFFNITLIDSFFPHGLILFDYEIEPDPYTPSDPFPPVPPPVEIIEVNGILLALAAAGITAFVSLGATKYGRRIKIKIRKGEYREQISKDEPKLLKDKFSDDDDNSLFADWD